MKRFFELLNSASRTPRGERDWYYLPYDQLNIQLGALAAIPPLQLGIVLVETPAKAARRPYHKQKLALILANQRHFALEQAHRGVAVLYRVSAIGYADALRSVLEHTGTLRVQTPAERELRQDLQPLVESGEVEFTAHGGWLTTREQFLESQGTGAPWRMDAFYRHIRRSTHLLMTDYEKPVGGKFSFDLDNRQAWKGKPPAPAIPRFENNEITAEVVDLIETQYSHHPGRIDIAQLPTTHEHAERLWAWAKHQCLPHFGPYEDAMSSESRGLFHTRIAPLLHLHRLLPKRVINDALELDIPLASQEGFIRQIVGWREFVRHVHEETQGFRNLESTGSRASHHRLEPCDPDTPADPSYLGSRNPLPATYWGEQRSGLHCLDQVVREVWEDGYSHHITRLMILANIATLLDVSPRELTDWFWVAYTDAYDWVVEPNVLAMGTFGVGDLMTTKPYVSGSAYIKKMSDYCKGCRFDPQTTCPITPLYWAFLNRKRDALHRNPRMALALKNAERRTQRQQLRDAATFHAVSTRLAAGEVVDPAELP